jgi:dimethylhistidine N-methyltransferase
MNLPLAFIEVPSQQADGTFAAAVLEGLSLRQKTLPSRFFYDTAGSDLFEQITRLPEYYLTRSEESILQANAESILRRAGDGITLVEFGSGSSYKTRLLIDAALRRQARLHYVPIDISADFLGQTAKRLLSEYRGLSITALAAEYRDAVTAMPDTDGPRLILFLGSNIGNFDPVEAQAFLRQVRGRMSDCDRMLVGIDLVKDPSIIEAAYNDAQGVTAAFNRNVLARINRELGGRFVLSSFRHQAPFLPEPSKVEMRLISAVFQTVRVTAVERDFDFEAGEFIHTENSYKYTLASFEELCAPAGLRIADCWLDPNRWFAEVLLEPTQ